MDSIHAKRIYLSIIKTKIMNRVSMSIMQIMSKNGFPLMMIDYIDTFIISSTVNIQMYLKTFDRRIHESETIIKIICSLRLKKCEKFCMTSNIMLKLNWIFMPEIDRKLNLMWICDASEVNFKDVINLHKPLRKHKSCIKIEMYLFEIDDL